MSCLSDEILSAAVDGELSAESRIHLEGCGSCRRREERFHALDAALRGLPLASEAPPASLSATLRGLAASQAGAGTNAAGFASSLRLALSAPLRGFGAATRTREGRFLRPAVGALAAIAAVAVLVVAPVTGSPSLALAEEAVSNHLSALAMGDGSGCQIESEDPSTLARWLSETLGHEVEIPQLGGATLVGARRCSLLGEDTAAVVYRSGDSAFSLYLPPKGSAAAAACEAGRSRCIQGRDGQTVCVLPDPSGSPWLMVGGLAGQELCSAAVSG